MHNLPRSKTLLLKSGSKQFLIPKRFVTQQEMHINLAVTCRKCVRLVILYLTGCFSDSVFHTWASLFGHPSTCETSKTSFALAGAHQRKASSCWALLALIEGDVWTNLNWWFWLAWTWPESKVVARTSPAKRMLPEDQEWPRSVCVRPSMKDSHSCIEKSGCISFTFSWLRCTSKLNFIAARNSQISQMNVCTTGCKPRTTQEKKCLQFFSEHRLSVWDRA